MAKTNPHQADVPSTLGDEGDDRPGTAPGASPSGEENGPMRPGKNEGDDEDKPGNLITGPGFDNGKFGKHMYYQDGPGSAPGASPSGNDNGPMKSRIEEARKISERRY